MKKILSFLLVVMMLLSVSTVVAEEEPVTIKAVAVLNATTHDLDGFTYYQQFEEEANVHIEWELYRTGWGDKKPLMFASGELPDVFFGASAISRGDISQNIEYFLPLNDLIDEYCPNIKKMLEDDPSIASTVTWPDGSMYALPHAMAFRPSHFGAAIINQQWLDNLGLEMPTTTDEFIEVMRAFKTGDPNGNGIADEIPMLGFVYDANFGFRTLMGSFGITDSIDSDLAFDNDGNMVFVPATESYKNWIKFMNTCYSEGLIYSDFVTVGWDTILGLPAQEGDPIIGMCCGWNKAFINPSYNDQYVQLLPLIGPDGDQEWASNYTMVACGPSGYNSASITVFNEHPVETMKWLDCYYKDINGLQNSYGEVGMQILDNGDGTYTMIDSTSPEISEDEWAWGWSMGDLGPGYTSRDFEKNNVEPAPWMMEKLELDKGYEPYFNPNRAVPAVVLELDDEAEVVTITTDINRIVSEKRATWITEGGVDEEWDAYIQSLKDVGLDRYLEIEVDAVDAFNNR